jgi:NitT/TauT family transport system permease protein
MMLSKLPKRSFNYGVALLASVVAALLPLSNNSKSWIDLPVYQLGPALLILIIAFACFFRKPGQYPLLMTGFVLLAAWLALVVVNDAAVIGEASNGFWFYIIAIACLLWANISEMSETPPSTLVFDKLKLFLVPVLFGGCLIFIWEVIVVGFAVPQVLLPPPSMIGSVVSTSTHTLAADFHQTFIRAVIPGFIIGNCSGFIVALLADRIPFLRRGLLPLGNMVSAIPIVGIAPIMVMWFGFDWQSKAAVVVIMTFFPMLVNTMVGLSQAGSMEKDLMRSYAASYRQSLLSLRLPSALPFVFNALKINSTLALIGAIVAEFFGTPIVGMGFRISTEVGRMNLDMVWASILVAAIAGSLFYGFFALLERYFTFWHPSFRKRL